MADGDDSEAVIMTDPLFLFYDLWFAPICQQCGREIECLSNLRRYCRDCAEIRKSESRHAYFRTQWATDPQFRLKNNRWNRQCAKKRYQRDPEVREKILKHVKKERNITSGKIFDEVYSKVEANFPPDLKDACKNHFLQYNKQAYGMQHAAACFIYHYAKKLSIIEFKNVQALVIFHYSEKIISSKLTRDLSMQ